MLLLASNSPPRRPVVPSRIRSILILKVSLLTGGETPFRNDTDRELGIGIPPYRTYIVLTSIQYSGRNQTFTISPGAQYHPPTFSSHINQGHL